MQPDENSTRQSRIVFREVVFKLCSLYCIPLLVFTAVVVSALLYSTVLIRNAEVEWMEKQNAHTMDVFWYWKNQMHLDPLKALFDDDLVTQTWHANHLHPNIPVILMALLRGENAAPTELADASPLPPSRLFVTGMSVLPSMHNRLIIRTRVIPFSLGLMSVVLLLGWVARESGLRQAFCAGALVLMMPQFLARICMVSTGSAVVLIWVALLWLFHEAKDTTGYRIAAGILLGIGLGTKATFVLVPLCYLLYVWLERTSRSAGFRPSPKSGRFWFVVLIVAFGVHLLLWPWLWRDPVGRIIEHLAANRHGGQSAVQMLGFTFERPPSFYPLWFLLTTTPVPILILMASGIWMTWRGFNRADKGGTNDSWMRLHLVSVVVLLSVFILPLRVSLNGAEFFLPVYLSIAILASEGIRALTDRSRLNVLGRSIPLDALALGVVLLCVLADFRVGESLFRYRNLAGTLLREPTASAFPPTADEISSGESHSSDSL